MDVYERTLGEVVLSIIVNWLIGLLPAVFIRFVVLRKPMEKTPAIWLTAGIGVVLVFLVTLMAHTAEARPNMAPVFIWILITHWILRSGKKKAEA